MANPPSYASSADIKVVLPGTYTVAHDAVFEDLLQSGSRMADAYCGRHPGAFQVEADTIRYFTGSGNKMLDIDEIAVAPTTVAVSEQGSLTSYTTWAATEFILGPYNAPSLGQPYTWLELDQINGTKLLWYKYPKSVKITGKWGYSTICPEPVKKAVVVIASRLYKRGQAGFQDYSGTMQFGRQRMEATLDSDIKQMLDPFVRMAI